jgi:hypothetical protein
MVIRPFTVLLAIGVVIPVSVGAQQTSTPRHTVLVRKNTALQFEPLPPLDPLSAKIGDDVPMQLARPLVVDGIKLLPTGGVFHARVTKVKQPTKCKEGEVELELNRVTFADSTTAKTRVLFVTSV